MEKVLYQKRSLAFNEPPVILSIRRMTKSRINLRLRLRSSVELLIEKYSDSPKTDSSVLTTRRAGDALRLAYKDKIYRLHIVDIHKEVPHTSADANKKNYVVVRLEEEKE